MRASLDAPLARKEDLLGDVMLRIDIWSAESVKHAESQLSFKLAGICRPGVSRFGQQTCTHQSWQKSDNLSQKLPVK
jgi:hypothetical protein